MGKIKVVWICHLSNSQVREHLRFAKWTPLAILRRIMGKIELFDFAAWNTNAIREFERFDDVELHIIAPHYHICGVQEFAINGINYHFFQSEDDNIMSLLQTKILKKERYSYSRNTRVIAKLINRLHPDLIHCIGAENPYYSESVLSLPKNYPIIVSLQTLVNDPDFFSNYYMSRGKYEYISRVEKSVIVASDYVGSKVQRFRKLIHQHVSPDIKFLDMSLAVGEDVVIAEYDKCYDFVYFAADISKAADYAIEAYAIAKQTYKDLTLHIVGGYSDEFKIKLESRLQELGICSGVDFTGKLPTHADVINEIRKARFAVLPLKIDLIAGTIRESMANGLPVVTTITPATPKLNDNRESVLLSEKGDFEAMANNMVRLLSDAEFAEMIKSNAAITMNERYSNSAAMKEWRQRYYEVLQNCDNY